MFFGLLLVLIVALYTGIGGYLLHTFLDPHRAVGHLLLAPAAVLVAGALLALLLTVRRRTFAAIVTLCLAMALTWTSIPTWVMPVVEAYKPMKPLALAIKQELRPETGSWGTG